MDNTNLTIYGPAGNRRNDLESVLRDALGDNKPSPSVSELLAQSLPNRDESKSAANQGMFRKFEVLRTDGQSAPGKKHYGCRYFVLDLDHDQHAPAAMRAYADDCSLSHPLLAADINVDFPALPDTAELPEPWQQFADAPPASRNHYAEDQMLSFGAQQREAGRREGIVQRDSETAPQIKRMNNMLELQRTQLGSEAWAWVGDGTDYLESMGSEMAVVIRADQLRGLVVAGYEEGLSFGRKLPDTPTPEIDDLRCARRPVREPTDEQIKIAFQKWFVSDDYIGGGDLVTFAAGFRAASSSKVESNPPSATAERIKSISRNHDAMIILTQSYPAGDVIKVVDAHTKREVDAALSVAPVAPEVVAQDERAMFEAATTEKYPNMPLDFQTRFDGVIVYKSANTQHRWRGWSERADLAAKRAQALQQDGRA